MGDLETFKKDKDDSEEEDKDAVEEAEEEEEDEEEEEGTEAPDAGIEVGGEVDLEEIVDAVVDETVVGEADANATDVVLPGETFEVALDPFSLTVDSAINEEDLMLEEYLFNYIGAFLPNLVSVELTSEIPDMEEPSTDSSMDEEDANATDSRRFLAEMMTIYYEGTATFEGPPQRDGAEVDAYLTQALEDEVAILAHLATTPLANTNTTVTATPDDVAPPTVSIEAEGEETKEDEGLSTTGLSIVIVAAVVGGISLLIILMVGLSGPSGSTSGMKGGLPEQPLQ